MVVSSAVSSQPSVILVVDSDPERQREMRDRLMVLGYKARSVDDFEAALEMITNTPPDVVLLTGHDAPREEWDVLQTQLNMWGIPLIDLARPNDAVAIDSVITTPLTVRDEELKLRVDNALQSRSLRDALMAENARLAAERLNDPLTGLFNRRYIIIRTEEEILRSSRRGHPLSCLLADLDDFNEVNENWGHHVGDSVLKEMAHLMTRTLRGTDIVCRYRDDQFMVLLTDTDSQGAQIAANRVRDAVAAYTFLNPLSAEAIKLTASVGVSYWEPGRKSGESTWEPQLLGLAERALKAAKQSGQNRLVVLQAS